MAMVLAFAVAGGFPFAEEANAQQQLDLRPGTDGGNPIAWIAEATACAAPLTWVESPLTPFNRRPAWQRNSFTDAEGSYTRDTRGDAEAAKSTGPTIRLVEGQSAIFNDWVSFPRDARTDRVLFYGGGHGGYAGGDIYLWDMRDDSFEMVFEPRRLKYRGLDPDDPTIELWLPSDGSPPAPHTYGVALWHSSGKVLWNRGGPFYGYKAADGTRRSFRASDPAHRSDLKIFDATGLEPGRGDPARWSWGPEIKQVVSTAPAVVELPDGRVLFVDEELRVALYDVDRNWLGPWQRTASAGRIGAGHAVYSPFDGKIYVRAGGAEPGIWRIDPRKLMAQRLAVPAEIPERKAGFGNYRKVWYARSGLVAAGRRLMAIGAYGSGRQREPGRFGHIYFHDLADNDRITWVDADGPDLWSVHGKSWYLPREGVIVALPGADQPPWLMPLPRGPADAPPTESSPGALPADCNDAAR